MVFVLYALALTTGTHWPRLELPPESPASDKTIHVVAFCGLTLLLWRTGWISRAWLIAAVALVWSALDEVSQGLPGLYRTVSIKDLIANIAGVFAALLIGWTILGLRRMRRAPQHV